MYNWANNVKAKAPCFIRDVLAMREIITEGSDGSLYWLGHIPCRIVHVIGVVIGIDVCDRWTVYTVDDSTAVIECVLRHPPPYANVDRKSMSTQEWRALRKIPPPPPPHVTAVGYPVEVIGKVMQFHDACDSSNDQWKHFVTVVGLHKSKYSVPKPFVIPLEMEPDVLQNSVKGSPSADLPHPSKLRPADLTDHKFKSYLKHYMLHAPGNVPHWDITSPAFTLSHLRRIPELAHLASRVVHAETRRRAQRGVHATQPHLRVRMKRLFMWAILRLYEEGAIVLYDKPLIPISLSPSAPPVNLPVANSSASSDAQQCVTSDDDAYLSDPPPLEEDEAYVPVTAMLLAQPVRDVMSARGIRGKSPRVRAEDVLMDLKKLDYRWARVDLQTVDEAIDTIVIP
ncbi:hypothetical protein P692DRAFT_20822678 [Suillus brevipes Sb2]|nr:hypothetical protein P692DRAFT_20822678 [Suillus brevipes Sb2]